MRSAADTLRRRLMTAEQVAKRLGVTQQMVSKLVREGTLPHVRLGPRIIVFVREDVDRMRVERKKSKLIGGE